MRRRWHQGVNGLVLLWLAAAGVVAVAHRWIPAAPWLMTHLLLLGAASTAILIWSAHFAQAVRRRPLPGGVAGQTIRLAGHTVGAVAVVVGLLTGTQSAVVGGGVLVAAVALWHAAALVELGRHRGFGGRLGWTSRYFVGSALALPVGVWFGVRLADGGDGATYLGHVGVLLLGWVGLAVLGSLMTLWPTMLRVPIEASADRAGKRALPVLGVALLSIAAGAAGGVRPLVAVGLLTYLGGLALTGRTLAEQARSRRPDTFASRSVAASLLWFAAAVAIWTVLVAAAPSWEVARLRTGALLAPLAVGFAAQVLVASLSHLGPMVLGGGPAAVRAARDVVERGGGARLVLINGGLALFLLPGPSLVRVAASMLVLGALATCLVLLVRAAVVSHRLRTAPDATGPGATPLPLTDGPPRRRRSGALAASVALAAVVVGGVVADPAAVGLGSDADAGVVSSGRVVEVAVAAQDMEFVPDVIEVAPGDALVLVVTNTDDVVHDLVLDSGASSPRLAPGESARVEVGVVGRSVAGWCSIAGHRQLGMVLTVVVAGTQAGGEGGRHGTEPELVDLRGEPGAGFEPWPAALAAAAGTRHRVELTVTELEREVAPGIRQTLWTFDGSAPGPVLRGKVGDTFEITLRNDGSVGHSIDFHAGALAPDEPMRTIEPGESLSFTFTADRAGIWMYHCSTMPISLHIANGMFGAVIIDPPGLPAVDREYLLVQSELYLGPQGESADATKVRSERADAVVFNGYANQYDQAPLVAEVGERVRIWVLNAGPNRASAFHVVGGQFDTVYSEGAYLLTDGPGGSQVLPLLAAQGGFVELEFPQAGSYPFVSHVMVDAERGAHGLVRVTETGQD